MSFEDCSRGGLVGSKVLGGRHRQAKTRRIALQFLSNIYMEGEETEKTIFPFIFENSYKVLEGKNTLLPSPGIILAGGEEKVDKISMHLRGRKCQYINKKQVCSRTTTKWVHVRWEKAAISSGMLESRMFMSSLKSYPTMCYSIKPFHGGSSLLGEGNALKSTSVALEGDMSKMGKRTPNLFSNGISYGHLLFGAWGSDNVSRQKIEIMLAGSKNNTPEADLKYWIKEWVSLWKEEREAQRKIEHNYHSNFIDDPRLSQGAHKTVIRKIAPMYMFSILRYANHKKLKDELNKDYRELHPWIPPSLSLSKIRNLKREVLEYWSKNDFEMSTLALAIVQFEKLVMKKLVIKRNRKLKFALCLILAFKFNESESLNGDKPRYDNKKKAKVEDSSSDEDADKALSFRCDNRAGDVDYSRKNNKQPLSAVFDAVQHIFNIGKKEVLKYEMKVFAELSFGLFSSQREVIIHFKRLLGLIERKPREYIGEIKS
jgi:hypothetical protein